MWQGQPPGARTSHACAGSQGGLLGTPCMVVRQGQGVGFWLEEGSCLAGVPARLQREKTGSELTIPRRALTGTLTGRRVGTWQLEALGAQEPLAGWSALTHLKALGDTWAGGPEGWTGHRGWHVL